jgi:hypothetical protein
MKTNPIYLFYEVVVNGSDCTLGGDGDVHYRCYHGVHKICTIKRSMKGNLNGALSIDCWSLLLTECDLLSVLVNNLRVHVKSMYQLYWILKDRDEPPTPDEIAIASGKQQLDVRTEAEYLQKLNKSSENIKKAFQDQQARLAVSEIYPFIGLSLKK